MELIKKDFTTRVKNFLTKVLDDNLFLLASSISFYSALAIAPFLLILLGVASLIGGDIQEKLVTLASEFSLEVGQMIQLIFSNVNDGLDLGSLSGLIGVFVLFSTSSLVFLQLRYSLDVIYGQHLSRGKKSIWVTLTDKLFAMFVVFVAGLFLIISSSLPGVVQFIFGENENLFLYKTAASILNVLIYVAMFWGIHHFTPTKSPGKSEALKMAGLSSLFFMVGNFLLASYFRDIASTSIYGAAGSLLIFLIWTYYTSFTLFLSVEVFLFIKKSFRPTLLKVGQKGYFLR